MKNALVENLPFGRSKCISMHFFVLICILKIPACGRAEEPHNDQIPDAANKPMNSIHRLLGPSDYDKFRIGRGKDQILADVQWRGNFEMACRLKEKKVYAISFEFFSDDLTGHGEEAWAIFIDEKFEKFVHWPERKMKDVPYYNGTTLALPVPIKLGNCERLLAALNSAPVTYTDLINERKARGEPERSIDPGLIIIFLLARLSVVFDPSPSEKELRINASLRDQFNASRLNIGMTQAQVETTLGAKPISSGECNAGRFALYGSHKSLNIISPLHYSNVLIVYQNGKVNAIYSGEMIPGGDVGLREVRDAFSDFPQE